MEETKINELMTIVRDFLTNPKLDGTDLVILLILAKDGESGNSVFSLSEQTRLHCNTIRRRIPRLLANAFVTKLYSGKKAIYFINSLKFFNKPLTNPYLGLKSSQNGKQKV